MKRIFAVLAMLVCICVAEVSATQKDKADTEPFDRGISMSTNTFIPKGTVGGGLSVTYNTMDLGQSSNDVGYSILSLLTGVKGSMYSVGIAPNASYFLANNLSVGLRLDYDRTSLDLDNLGISLGDMLSLSISDYHYLKQSFSGAATCRYYMPIADSRRFAMFAEARLMGGYGQSLTYKMDGEDKFGTYQDIYNAALNFVPGLAVFATNNVALEISVGVLGIDYKLVKQVTNQVEKSVMQDSGMSFKINLLSINLGIALYVPTGVHRTLKSK